MSEPVGPLLEVTLRRNRLIGVVASCVFILTGVVIVVVTASTGRGIIGFALGAVLIVPGVWAIPAMLRPWRLDASGIHHGRRRVLTWPEVDRLEIRDVRVTRPGLGPSHVRVIIHGSGQRADLTIYSYRDAQDLAQMLADQVSPRTAGFAAIPRIAGAWAQQR